MMEQNRILSADDPSACTIGRSPVRRVLRHYVRALALTLSVMPAAGLAQGVGIDVGYQRTGFPVEIGNAPSSVDLDAVVGRIAYDFTGRFGVEGMLGIGTGGATVDDTVDMRIEYESSYGLFLSARTGLSDSIFVSARAGALSIKSSFRFTVPEIGLSESLSDRRRAGAAGIGIEYRFGRSRRNNSVKLGWIRAEDDLDLVSVTFGLRL